MGSSPDSGLPWTEPLDLFGMGPELQLAFESNGEGGGGEWVEWSGGGRFVRVLVARLAWREEEHSLHAVKLQRDSYVAPSADPFGAVWDNAAVDEGWRRETAAQGETEGALARCVNVTDAQRTIPATTYCRTKRVFFRAFCPASLLPLRTCKDDERLAEWGLEPYSGSLVRYASGNGGSSARPASVYTWSRDGGTDAIAGLAIRRRSELYRDYAVLWDRDLTPDQRSRLERVFPCWKCEHRPECYSKPDSEGRVVAEKRLVPLNYYEANALLLEGLDLHVDDLGRLLGGAPAAGILEKGLSGTARAGRRALLADQLDGTGAWLTPGSMSSDQLAREVAYLKLRAFQQVCTRLEAFHRGTGRAHFDLSPEQVMARYDLRTESAVPGRWTHEVRLVDAGAVQRITPDSKAIGEDVPELFVPRQTADSMHRSPFVDPGSFRTAVQGRLTIRSATEGEPALIEFDAENARFQDTRPGDLVRLAPAGDLPGSGDAPLIGRVLGVRAGKLRIGVRLPSDRCPSADSLPCEKAAEVVVFQNYGPACDLWGLGMLFARLFLVHDERDAFAVEDRLRELVERFERGAAKAPGTPESWARNLVAQAKDLDSASVLHDRRLRESMTSDPLPEGLWSDLWVFALRLLTRTEGFAFASAHDEPARMDEVSAQVRELAQRLQVEVFGADIRRAELRSLVQDELRQRRREEPE